MCTSSYCRISAGQERAWRGSCKMRCSGQGRRDLEPRDRKEAAASQRSYLDSNRLCAPCDW
ncbi:hypothetical protein CABS01_02476 [Colletotrichum abscissum]|uniref:uncharacterized protein n=1 Tax=Colletotrichum abscissum TaxID=1671311 RepID=UPI0027D70196|nr:uncharacterized protein CABS01_02476 [Colletotrichum abscissum]KAK1488846.1 hypothetical protein CABS01_02476 [Colletotrichum abscissum]